MRLKQIAVGLALALAGAMPAQRTATTMLSVRVDPETHLNPTRVSLQFRVSADGSSDVVSQTEMVSAWVRALPGQTIHVRAMAAGTLPVAALRWNGAVSQAAGGGRQASCTSGSFAGGGEQELAASWTRSGTLACAVTFSLADARGLAPGVYSGTVELAVR